MPGFPDGTAVKNPPANAGDVRDVGLIPASERSPGGGNGDPLQYSCLGNPMDRGALQATVHRVAESDTTERLSRHAHQLALIHTVSPAAFSSNQGERWRGRWLDL